MALDEVKKAFYAIILALVLVAGVYCQGAFSSLTTSVVINSAGQIAPIVQEGPDVYLSSGSASVIQAAVNLLSSSGGTVHIPAGTFYWNGETVTIPSGVNVVGASPAGCKGHEDNWESYSATTILHNNAVPPVDKPMFEINDADDGQGYKKTRISGIQFEATAPPNTSAESQEGGQAIKTWCLKDFRIDHCTFINFAGTAVTISSSDGRAGSYTSYGVIDHCVIDNPYKLSGYGWQWGYGFYSIGDAKSGYDNWDSDVTHFAGRYDTVPSDSGCTVMFVEDCHMSRCRHATDGLQGSWNVVRFNLFDYGYPPWGDICLHGSQSWYSGRGMEVYNNTVIGTTDYLGIGPQNLGGVRLRGGSGFVFNNIVKYTEASVYQTLMVLDNIDYSGTYPFTNIDDTYIWNNININCTTLRVLQGSENVNYFLRAPTYTQDGFTYTPYPYPHPLVT